MNLRKCLAWLFFLLIIPTDIFGLWWPVGNPLDLDSNRICKRSKKIGGKQREICRKEPEVVEKVILGSIKGTEECQYQMRLRKWNCTTGHKSFTKILQRDTRETAFINSITSAGVTYAITQACSMGELLQCGCDDTKLADEELNSLVEDLKKRRSTSSESLEEDDSKKEPEYRWGGCADNINYGYQKSKEFMDATDKKRSDISSLISLHNNEAGRLAIKQNMRIECKCHGLCSSCTLNTCWKKMPTFRYVGHKLKEKFDGASKVMGDNDGRILIPAEGKTIKHYTKDDLVYSQKSPDFCKPDKQVGSLGTEGRICNSTSLDVGGCDLLCCERGHSEKTLQVTENCKCRFHWCCKVECDECTATKTFHTCNGFEGKS